MRQYWTLLLILVLQSLLQKIHVDAAVGDFEALNELIRDAIIEVPDVPPVSGGLMEVKLSNLRCTNFQIDDIKVSFSEVNERETHIQLDLNNLDMICFADFWYDGLIFSGRGSAEVFSFDNRAGLNLSFMSENFNFFPPQELVVKSCNPTVNINDLNFDGGFLGLVLDRVESLFRNAFESQAEKEICNILRDLSNTRIAEMLEVVQDKLSLYPLDMVKDPLETEAMFEVPENVKLFNFKNQEKETDFGRVLDIYLFEAVEYLSRVVEDPKNGAKDININVLLRNILDKDRAFTLDISKLDFVNKGKIYEVNDRLTETTIWLNQVKVSGLDTLTTFEPISYVGSQTLQTGLSWDYLAFELNVTIDMRPSTLPNSVIENPGSTRVVETVKIETGIERLHTVASLFLGIDQVILETLQLGSLLKAENILPCFLSTIIDIIVSSLSVDFSKLRPPTLVGFVSTGIDRVVSDSVKALYTMYEAASIEALPGFFHLFIRDYVNKIISEYLQDEVNRDSCPLVETPDSYSNVDYRDLFLEPAQALAIGGSGGQPYGDLVSSFAMPWVKQQFLTSDERGLPKINSRILQPLTKLQSGEAGSIIIPFDVVKVEKHKVQNTTWSWLLEKFEFTASNVTIRNIDTFTSISLFDSIGSEVLSNRIDIGPVPLRPLEAAVKVLLSMEGEEESPLAMRNELDIDISVPSVDLMIDIMALISERKFLEFPFRDTTNHHCWLYIMTNGTNSPLDNQTPDLRLDLSRLAIAFSALSTLKVRCTSCTSPGAEALSGILEFLKQTSISPLSLFRIEKVAEDFAQSLWRFRLQSILNEAPKFCPHSPYHDPAYTSEGGVSDWILPRSVVELLVTVGILTINAVTIAVAKDHTLRPLQSLSSQANTSSGFQENPFLLDWTNLGSSLGSWSVFIFEKVQAFLEDDLRFFTLVRKWLLADNQVLNLNFNDLSIRLPGAAIALNTIRIHGLDSLQDIKLIDAVAPQTLQNHLQFEKIGISIDVDIDSRDEAGVHSVEKLSHSVQLKDAAISFDSLIAMDINLLGDITLGLILDTKKILPCVVTAAIDLSTTELLFTASEIGDPWITGFLSSNLNDTISSIAQLLGAYQSDLVDSLPMISDTTIRVIVNNFLSAYGDQSSSLCIWVPPNNESLVDFRDLFFNESMSVRLGGNGSSRYGDLFQTLFNAMNQQLLKVESIDGSSINDVLGSLTKKQSNFSGVITYPGTLFNFNSSFGLSGLQADIAIEVSNLRAENLDSVSFIQLLHPLLGKPNTINNTLSMGSGSRPLRLSGTFMISLQDAADMQIRNEIDISLDLHMLSITAALLIRLSEERLFSFPLKDIFDLNCWFAILDTKEVSFELEYYAVLVKELGLGVDCVSCTSTNFAELILQLYSPTLLKDATAFVNGTIGRIYKSDLMLGLIDGFLNDSAVQCPHDTRYLPNATIGNYLKRPSTYLGVGFEEVPPDEKSRYFTLANSIIAGVLLLLAILVRFFLRQRNRIWIRSLSREAKVTLSREQDKEQARDAEINKMSQSMFHCHYIPRNVRLAVPAILVADIILYLVAHLGILSTLNIDVYLAGQSFTINEFLQFSFIQSTIRTFHNGGREMAVLMFVFTGVWPYVKLLLSLVLWFIPPQKFSVSHRGNCLLWLDVWARLSVVDIFTMLLAVGAILIFTGGPADESLTGDGGDYISIKAIVVPGPSFYCIVIAQRISRVSSRFLLDYHNFIVDLATREFEVCHGLRCTESLELQTTIDSWEENNMGHSTEEKISVEGDNGQTQFGEEYPTGTSEANLVAPLDLAEEVNDPSWDNSRHKFHKKWSFVSSDRKIFGIGNRRQLGGTVAAIFTFVTVICLFVIGCILAPSIAFDTKSIWGLAVESGKTYEEVVQVYSVFRVIYQILLHARFVLDTTADYVGLGFLLTVGILSALMFPLIKGFSFIRKWVSNYRWSSKAKPKLCSIKRNENKPLPVYLQRTAWRHMEVYVISFVVACWQLGSVSAYAVHLYCNILGRIFDVLSYAGLVEPTSAQCFRIQASHPGYLIIVCLSFLVLLASFLIQAFCQFGKNKEYALRLLEERSLVVLSSSSKYVACRQSLGSFLSATTNFQSKSVHDNGSDGVNDNDGKAITSNDSTPAEDGQHSIAWSSESSFFIGDIGSSQTSSVYVGDVQRI